MNGPPAPGRVRRAAALTTLAALALAAIAAAATPTPPPAASKPRPASKPAGATRPATPARPAPLSRQQMADAVTEARELEDAGAYSQAADRLRALRPRVQADADLELALALDEARSGQIDSAWSRLWSPLLSQAVRETLPVTRRRELSYRREFSWLNGPYDGWAWYVWRARAELAASKGRWEEALAAARECVNARPLSGKEWLILALAAARTGNEDEARAATREAVLLDPTLPEVRYLLGLWEWKAGRRSEAAGHFRQAVALDSAFAPAALALMRSRLPGAAPDTIPGELLTGPRRVALVTAPERPKPEEFVQVDVSALLESSPDTAVVDSILPGVKPLQLVLSVLVDDRGRPVLNDIPWFPRGQISPAKISRLLSSVPSWRFTPAIRLGAPHPVWVSLNFHFNP